MTVFCPQADGGVRPILNGHCPCASGAARGSPPACGGSRSTITASSGARRPASMTWQAGGAAPVQPLPPVCE
eukprot:5984170-Pyramimonas_sp.AAC.1